MFFVMYCNFDMGSVKSTFSKYSFGRKEKSTLCTPFDNVENFERPLTRLMINTIDCRAKIQCNLCIYTTTLKNYNGWFLSIL